MKLSIEEVREASKAFLDTFTPRKFVAYELEYDLSHDCHAGPEDSCDCQETLCRKPHNNGDNDPESCVECMAIKLHI